MSERLLLTIVEASLRAFLLAASVGALLLLLRVPRGAARHGAWLVVVVGMLAMPLLQRLAPVMPRVPAPRVLDVTTFLPTSPSLQPLSRIASPVPSAASPPAPFSERTAIASPSTTEPASGPDISWLRRAGAAYGLITLALLLRLAVALGSVRQFIASAVPLGDGLYESRSLATPVTVGVIRPRIVLPATWRSWSETTRDAVVAHERAHAQRRDPLVALLTRLNVCIFWFHPLAWWLERTLADAAEQACDEIAVRAVPQPREYAETLLMMAAAARQGGSRIAWAGVRAEGSGRLSDRIDRILDGTETLALSRVRRGFALAGCVTLVVAAVACRAEKQVTPLVLESPADPGAVARRGESERAQLVRESARALTWEQVATLEADWRRNPENLEALERLLFFYEPDISGTRTPEDAKKIAGRRPLILWLIEHHPDSPLLRELPGRIFGHTDWLMDPDGYEAAKKLWLAQAARPDVSVQTLTNAAWFLNVEDKPLAERLLLQGQHNYPGPDSWSLALGRLYAQAIVGSNRFTLGNSVQSADPNTARGEYATRVRATLDKSRDPVLLSEAGLYLARNASLARTDFDRLALARTCVERAVQIDPRSVRARYALDSLDLIDQSRSQQRLLTGVPPESIPGVIAKLPEDQRLPILVKRAGHEYLGAQSANWRSTHPQTPDEKVPARIEENRQEALVSRERSKKYAEDALALANNLRNHPDRADALFAATIALAAHAFWDGDRQAAVRHVRAAAGVPPSSSGRLMSPILNLSLEMKLIGGLLNYGERETVIQYFERSAETRPADRERLLAAATAIRNGKLPLNYERR